MIRNVLTLGLLVLVLVGTVLVVQRYRTPGSMTVIESQAMDMSVMTAPPGTMPVRTATVEEEAFAPTATYTGTVRAWNDEDVVARVTGQVVRVHVYPGDRVAPGQLLVELDSQELESRRAEARGVAEAAGAKARSTGFAVRRSQAAQDAAREEVRLAGLAVDEMMAEERSARINLDYKSAELERVKRLYDGDAVSLEELQKTRAEEAQARMEDHHKHLGVERARIRVTQAKLALAAARAGVGEAEAERAGAGAVRAQQESAQRTARILEGYTQIRAQSPATVTERVVSPGTLVMPGAVLLRLKQVDRLRLQARVPSTYAEQLKVGSPVKYRPGGSSDSSSRWRQARITSIFREADPSARTVTVEAILRDAHLVPGDYLEMTLAQEREQPRLTLPYEAVHRDLEDQPFVWLLQRRDAPTRQQWTCVMHPEVVRDQPGKCPKCGMDLVPKESAPVTSVTTKPDYTCPMHPEVSSDKPGKCPKCGMDLELRQTASATPSPEPVSQGKPTATPAPGATPEKTDFTCVMHPEVSSDRPGKCPKCGMDLVPREKKGPLTVHRQPITLGGSSGKRVAVSKGLSAGDEVVVAGASNLREGMAVSRAESSGSAPASPSPESHQHGRPGP